MDIPSTNPTNTASLLMPKSTGITVINSEDGYGRESARLSCILASAEMLQIFHEYCLGKIRVVYAAMHFSLAVPRTVTYISPDLLKRPIKDVRTHVPELCCRQLTGSPN
jgi:hypothetical protein